MQTASALQCVLWIIFLLLGFSLLLLTFLDWRRRNLTALPTPSEREAHSILWLTPEVAAFLGECANPSRLRNMTEACIKRLIDRWPYPSSIPRPTPDQYRTWPKQAQLLCDGKLDDLERYQQEISRDLGTPTTLGASEPKTDRTRTPNWPLLLFGLLSIFLAILFWCLAEQRKWCACVPPTTVTVLRKTVDFASDKLFDFNRDEPFSDHHRAKMLGEIKLSLASFDRITIESIVAYTDPIGATGENVDLARRRAAFIENVLGQVVRESDREGQFASQAVPAPNGSPVGPSPDDFAYWQACFSQFYLANSGDGKDNLLPLVDLPRSKRDRRAACSEATDQTGRDGLYPACARLELPDQPRRGYAVRAERFRELTACLAPMRHVTITFKHEQAVSQDPIDNKKN
jgi:hypothetical protein